MGCRGARQARQVAAALVVIGLSLLSGADTGQAHERERVRHAAPTTVCSVTDPRLTSISGMAESRGALYVANDTSPVTIYRLGDRCQVVEATKLTIPAAHDPRATLRTSGDKEVDLEDMAVDADGALWLGDIGGNTSVRSVISLYRWVPGTTLDADRAGEVVTRSEAKIRRPNRVTRYDLRYPDGAHDAEALLVSLTGQVVVVTKVQTGVAGIYAAELPLAPITTLRRVGSLAMKTWLPGRTPVALAVTGGAVAPDGVHFALRTHGQALEWDAPDGDVVTALTGGFPRSIALGKAPQGEAITYGETRPELLTEGEQLPAPLGAVALYREAAAAPPAGPVFPVAVLAGAAAAGLLCIAIGVLAWRRHEGGAS